MNQKRKLKSWVKVALLLLPQIIIAVELFLIGKYVDEIKDQRVIIIEEYVGVNYGE